MIIRDATPEDALETARVHVEAWRETYAGIMAPEVLAALSVDQRAATRRAFLTSPAADAIHLLLVEDGRVVGFLDAGPARNRPGEAEIYTLYLLRSAQRRGFGLRLMADAVRRLQRAGYERLTLEVARDNAPARAFYEKLGGRTVATGNCSAACSDHVPAVVVAWDDLAALAAAFPPAARPEAFRRDLAERIRPLQDRAAASRVSGAVADKAFYDSLNDE